MNYIKALSIDIHFYEMIQLSDTPIFIHSVFARTINIIVDNELYTIASSQLDNAPATMRIDLISFENFNLNPNDTIILADSKMKVSDSLFIDLNSATLWKSELPRYPINNNQLNSNVHFAKKFTIEKGKADWLRGTNDKQTLFYDEMGRMLRERTSNLMDSFLFEATIINLKKSMKLVGLGQGLTPSGDDFLVGVMVAFSTVDSNLFNKKDWALQVVQESKERTNSISYSALKYAEMGETRESIGLLIQALFKDNKEILERELLNVMNIGSSSGTEIIWGIINGLLVILKIGGLK